MKYIYLAILLSLFSCKKELDYEQVFGYVSKDSLLLIDVHSVSTMVELYDFVDLPENNIYRNFLRIPFDFESNKIKTDSRTGIPINTYDLNFCKPIIHLAFHKDDQGNWMINDEIVVGENLDSLITLNYLNEGFNPKLSDTPKKTFFTFYLEEDEPLTQLENILGKFSEAYMNFLTDNEVEIDSLKNEFPLHIFLMYEYEIPPMPNIDEDIIEAEIEEDLELNLDY